MHPLSYTLDAILEEKTKYSIEREIRLLRELLSNLQEELCYIRTKDKKRWERVMQDRYYLFEGIKELRRMREGASWNESSEDLVFLLDQVMVLLQKVDSQAKYNDTQQAVAISPTIAYSMEKAPQPCKKSGVVTLM